MTLTIRKLVVLGLIGSILLLGNILFVANWLAEKSMVDWARAIRAEYLTGTAITIIVVLLILLMSPTVKSSRLTRRCPVCDHVLMTRGSYCSDLSTIDQRKDHIHVLKQCAKKIVPYPPGAGGFAVTQAGQRSSRGH